MIGRSGVAAVRYLTRLPVPGPPDTLEDLRHVAVWFPVIGAALGGLIAVADTLVLSQLTWAIRNALVVSLAATLSGAIHLDALMDTTDGLATGREDAGAVMRASVHTAPGIITGALAMLLGWLALQGITGTDRSIWIVASAAFGRSAIVAAYRWLTPAASSGPVTLLLHASAQSPLTACVLGVVILALTFTLGPPAMAIIGGSVVLIFSTSALVQRHFGGMSGDHYGAIGAIIETLTFTVGALAITAPTL